MRVVLVDPVSFTLPYDHSLAAALARRGHAVDLLAARFPLAPPPAPDGYRRHEVFFAVNGRLLRRAPRSRLRFLLKGCEYAPSVWRLLRRIDALDPEIVHLQWLPLPRYDLRWVRAVARRRPTVFTAHDILPRRSEHLVDVWREIFATVERVVVHSRAGVERLAALGVEPERIVRIPHAAFEAPPGQAIEPPAGRTLLFFGLLKATKGLDLLLRALPAIAERVPDVRLVVAGDPLEPAEPLEGLARDLGVAGRIEWRLRYLPAEEVPELLAAVTAVVLPYRKIDSSGVLATAIGHGRPAVVTDVGSLGDTVREFGAGRVVPAEDVPALASACAELLLDVEALADAFQGTRAAARALSWDAAAGEHERLYATILGRRPE